MASHSVTIEGVPVPKGNKRKKVKLVRGRRRTVLQKAIRELATLWNQDNAEDRRGGVKGYTPYLVLGMPQEAKNRAFRTLQKALQDALQAKA